MASFLWQNAKMRGKTYNFADMELKDIIIGLYQFGLVALTVSGLIFASYSVGRHVLKKYGVPGWYFWVAWFFALPVIAAPVLLFMSLFMDHVKHQNLAPIAWGLINTWAVWFVLGFWGSMKLYGKMPAYISILPSVLSWIFAVAAVYVGVYLVSY